MSNKEAAMDLRGVHVSTNIVDLFHTNWGKKPQDNNKEWQPWTDRLEIRVVVGKWWWKGSVSNQELNKILKEGDSFT